MERYHKQYEKNLDTIKKLQVIAKATGKIRVAKVCVTTSGGGSKRFCNAVGVWRLMIVPDNDVAEALAESAMYGNGYVEGDSNVEWISWYNSGIPVRKYINLKRATNNLIKDFEVSKHIGLEGMFNTGE